MEKQRCACRFLIPAPLWDPDRELLVHLYGCPESREFKEYQSLKWYQKILEKDPYELYKDLFK